MPAAAATTSPSASTLHAALLDYFSAPGKYQLSLRQPATLFASIREVLQIAAGRGASADLPEAQTQKLREAAAFFIRAALLYPGADHYAVLGLPARLEPYELKERYRLLMRLTHPDFMPVGSAAWPADAAVRVNRANEVLSSPTLRKEYDEQLASLHSHRAAEAAMANAHRSAARLRQEERTWHVNSNAAWALVIALGIGAVMMLMPAADSTDLVQKLPVPLPAPQRLADAEVRKPLDAPAAPRLIPSDVSAATKPAPAAVASVPAAPAVAVAPALPPVAAARPLPAPAPARAAPPAPARAAPPAHATTPVAAPRRDPPPQVALAEVQNPARRPQPPAAPAPAARVREEAAPMAAAAPPVPQPVPAPAVAATPPPPMAVARPPAPIPAAAVIASPTLADVQPLLSQLLQMLESGRGEQLLRLLEADARRAPSAQALSHQYDQLVHGGRPVRLTQVDFRSEAREGVLQVTGRIRLHAGEPTIGSHGERFLFRAEFASRNGRVMLTGLSGAAD
jgi:hypothetical protein